MNASYCTVVFCQFIAAVEVVVGTGVLEVE